MLTFFTAKFWLFWHLSQTRIPFSFQNIIFTIMLWNMWSPDIIGKQNFKGLRTIFLLVVMRYSSHMIIFFSGYSASLNTCHASSHLILITEFQFSFDKSPSYWWNWPPQPGHTEAWSVSHNWLKADL